MPHESKDPAPVAENVQGFKCTICGQVCGSAIGLKSHIRHKHRSLSERMSDSERKRLEISNKINAKHEELLVARRELAESRTDRSVSVLCIPGRHDIRESTTLRERVTKLQAEVDGLVDQLKAIK